MKTIVLALVLGGVTFLSACYPREIVHTQRSIERDLPDSRFRREVALSFGPATMGLARWITRKVDDDGTQQVSSYLRDVRRVQFGLYETQNLPTLKDIALPSRLQRKIDREHWEIAAAVRETDERAWVLYRENGETVEDVFAIVFADNRLILARLEGNLNELVAKVAEDHRIIPELFPGIE